jgi:hypothetical protein
MSRMLRLVLIGLASSAVACGSSENGSATRSQAISGENCTDQNGCDGERPIPAPPGPMCAAASLTLNMCLDYGTLERLAALACESQGKSVSSISFDPPCDTSEPQSGPPAPPGPLPPDSEKRPDSEQTDPSGQPGGDDGKPPTGGVEPKPWGLAMGVKFACCMRPPPPSPCVEVAIPIDGTTNGDQVDPQWVCAQNNMVASESGSDPSTERPSYVRCCPGPISPPVERCMPVYADDQQTCGSKGAAEQQAAALCAARNFSYRSMTASPCGDNTGSNDGQDETNSELVRLVSALCCDAIAQPQDQDPAQKSGDQP